MRPRRGPARAGPRPDGSQLSARGRAMTAKISRRRFSDIVAGLALGAPTVAATLMARDARAAEPPAGGDAETFAFPVLGDLHFDRLEHHDMEWLARDHHGDVRQVENYSKLTREIMPRLF